MSLDEDTEFTIKTTHNPPVCVSLDETTLQKLKIPIFSACKRFQEENCYTFEAGETSSEPWKAIFDGFTQGRLKVDNNYFMDSLRIFHYMFVGDLTLYHEEVRPMIMFSKFSHYTMEGLEQLLEYVSLYPLEKVEKPLPEVVQNSDDEELNDPSTPPPTTSEIEPLPKKTVCNPLFPYSIPSNPEEVKEYLGVLESLVKRGLEIPENKVFWDFISYCTKTLDKIAEIDPTLDVLSYLQKKPYDLDEIMKPQMLYWMDFKKLLEFSVWAGGSLQMALFNFHLPKESDIDLWVFSSENLKKVLQGIYTLYEGQVYFLHQHSVITVYIDENYKRGEPKHPIQIIYMGEENNPYKVVRDFDLDYIKCYTDGKVITFLPECLRSHKTKTVYNCSPIIQSHRADKVRSRGFRFETVPAETKTERSHFFPDTSIFSKEFTKTILSKFHPFCKVLEKPEEIKEVTPFKRGVKEKDYTLTVIKLEDLENKLDKITCQEWHNSFGKVKTCHFKTMVELHLENVFVPFGIDVDPQTERANGRILLVGVPMHICLQVTGLENSISKHIKTRLPELVSKIRSNQFKTKIHNGAKVFDGLTGDPILENPLNLDLKQNMVSAVIQIRGMWQAEERYGLLATIVQLTVYPKNFNYNKRSILGIVG